MVTHRSPWRFIDSTWETFEHRATWEVGDGHTIRFWEDKWCGEETLSNRFPNLYRIAEKKDCSIAESLARPESTGVAEGWSVTFTRRLTRQESTEVSIMYRTLESIHLGRQRDKKIWTLENNKEYSVKSLTEALLDDGNGGHFPASTVIWSAKVPNKIKFFLWTVALYRVNTQDMVQKRTPTCCLRPNWCTLCKEAEESADHLFLQCKWTQDIWQRILSTIGLELPLPGTCEALLTEVGNWGRGRRRRRRNLCLIFGALWMVWKERNKRVFEDKEDTQHETWEKIRTATATWVFGHGLVSPYDLGG